MDTNVIDIALKTGTVLNQKYLINEICSWGHTSIIYIGESLTNQVKVTIKEFCPYNLVNRDLDGKAVVCKGKSFWKRYEEAYLGFEQECQIVKDLKLLNKRLTNNTLKYIEDFVENGTQYLITENIEGIGMDEMLEQHKEISIRKCMFTLVETVRGLHNIGIIHRDIKPSNLLICPNGNLVLIDYGSACYRGRQREELYFVSKGYSAPELYDRWESDIETDVYSIGALFYYLISGQLPTAADARLKGEKIVPLSELVEIPLPMERGIMKALQIDRKKRLKNLNSLGKICI